MKASEVIKQIQDIVDREGDLIVLVTEPHEYWGTLYYEPSVLIRNNAQPDGPKSGKTVKAIVIQDPYR